jgi:hypothetical protein
MVNFPTIKLAFNCPCALQPFSGGAILFFRRGQEGNCFEIGTLPLPSFAVLSFEWAEDS